MKVRDLENGDLLFDEYEGIFATYGCGPEWREANVHAINIKGCAVDVGESHLMDNYTFIARPQPLTQE